MMRAIEPLRFARLKRSTACPVLVLPKVSRSISLTLLAPEVRVGETTAIANNDKMMMEPLIHVPSFGTDTVRSP